MDTEPSRDADAVSAEIEQTREALAKAELEWKNLRAHSREITVELVTQHGVSVAKAAALSGHTRQTIKIWLDVYNAAQSSRKNSKE